MGNSINISLELDDSFEDIRIVIRAREKTKQIDDIIAAVERAAENFSKIAVYDGDKVVMLDNSRIFRVYTANRQLVICTSHKEYSSKMPLQDFGKLLDQNSFVRISRFEFINIRFVTSFDLSIAGTIKVSFEDGSETWVARRYVKEIQDRLIAMKGGI